MNRFIKNNIFTIYALVATIVLNLAYRSVLARELGESYLGLLAIITSLITFLQLAEAGIGQSTIHLFFDPIARGDNRALGETLHKIKSVFKKVFYISFFLICLISFPFLKWSEKIPEIDFGLEIFLFSAVSLLPAYLLGYSKPLFIADNRNHVLQKLVLFSVIIDIPIRIVLIALWPTPAMLVWSTLVMAIIKILEGVALNILAKRIYKEAFLSIESSEKLVVWTNNIKRSIVGSTFHKLGDFSANHFSVLLATSLLPLGVIGILSSYQLITFYILQSVTMILVNLIAPLGKRFQDRTIEMKKILESLLIVFRFFSGVVSGVFALLIQPFMLFWLGDGFQVTALTVMLLSAGLYFSLNRAAVNAVKTSLGIFYEDRYSPLVQGLVTGIFTVVLVPEFGIDGLVGAAIVGGLLVPAWYRPLIIYDLAFQQAPTSLLIRSVVDVFIFGGIGGALYFAIRSPTFEITLLFEIMFVIVAYLFAGYFIVYRNAYFLKIRRFLE